MTTATPPRASTATANAERRFRAMGTDCHINININININTAGKPDQLAQYAIDRIAILEQRWSRFLSDSEISRLNHDRRAQVSADTFLLIDRAVRAWTATGGRFDPTMQRQLVDAGYDRPFFQMPSFSENKASQQSQAPSATCAGITLDRFTSTVWLPEGVNLDPGGIGKGLAADIVTAELCDLGATSVLVNLGGDLRARSTNETSEPWLIDIVEPSITSSPLTTLALRDGAVASSTPLRRAWSHSGHRHHHLLDPETGRANTSPIDLVTVIAADGWWAESVATSLASSPSAADLSYDGAATFRVESSGNQTRTGGFDRYERSTS